MRVSVVTVAFNAAATILDTLRSVASQTHSDLEHIVVDGGSTDGTQEIVRTQATRLGKMVSEPDEGLYDAMNKGLALATGEVIAFLNADDWYWSETSVAHAVAAFVPGVDLVYGHMAQVDAVPPHRVKRLWREKPRTASSFVFGWQPAHPATFIRTERLRAIGGFDKRLRISADYGVLARCFLGGGVRTAFTPHVLANMRLGGASTSGLRAVYLGNRECLQILRSCGAPYPWLTIALKLARKSVQARAAKRVADDTRV